MALMDAASFGETLPSLEIPQHVAIIMDGNRRWAQSRGLPSREGHAAGVKALFRTLQDAANIGIEVLTVYGFSTENWNRKDSEVEALIEQIRRALDDYTEAMLKEGVKLSTIGDLSAFPQDVQDRIQESCRVTAAGTQIELVLALNYGGRSEICRAVQRLLQSGQGKDAITESHLARYLDTANWRDPDLLIRTSGEMRLSNFMLWQLSYAELYLTEVLWPDFTRQDLLRAIQAYQGRERRVGR